MQNADAEPEYSAGSATSHGSSVRGSRPVNGHLLSSTLFLSDGVPLFEGFQSASAATRAAGWHYSEMIAKGGPALIEINMPLAKPAPIAVTADRTAQLKGRREFERDQTVTSSACPNPFV
jgi:hypothetical protein